MSTRRQFLVSLGAGFLSVAPAVFAQTRTKMWHVGFLASRRRPENLGLDDSYGQFARSMRELGYVEGRNLAIEWRFADGKYERLPEFAAELVKLHVDIIVTDGTQGIRAAQGATRTIPIVFTGGSDVVGDGLVKSLARPGGNTTGLSLLFRDTAGKQLEILLSMVPRLSRLAVLLNPQNPATRRNFETLQAIAQTAKVQVVPFEAHTQREIESAFSLMVKERSEALLWLVDSFFIQQSRQIAELAAEHRLPSMSGYPAYAEAGGLMGYGANRPELYTRLAAYVDKILKGANPGELPVEQPTKLELIINRSTAKSLGLEIPAELLLLANKVID
jgi:putative ABC transport system substrate-binding protein